MPPTSTASATCPPTSTASSPCSATCSGSCSTPGGRWGWPEELGGLGGSSLLRGVLSEELAAAGCPPPFSFGMMEVLAPAVARFAPDIAARALPPLLRGDEAWCQGFSEPEAGSDLASLRLRAVDEGDTW